MVHLKRTTLAGLDLHVLYTSLILLLPLIPSFIVLHELGHAITCEATGYDVTEFGFLYTFCNFPNNISPITLALNYSSGGIFASLVGSTLLAVKRLREHQPLVIVLLTLTIFHIYNSAIETLFHDAYVITNNLSSNVVVLHVLILFTFLSLFFMTFSRKVNIH